MKSNTETEIAKENIRLWKKEGESDDVCYSHKATCKRWLAFLEMKQQEIENFEDEATNGFGQEGFEIHLHTKMQELKQAIALYEKEGI